MIRLFFKPVRLGREHLYCRACTQPLCCAKGAHHTEPLFSAIEIDFKRREPISVVLRCFKHVPSGSWVAGTIKPVDAGGSIELSAKRLPPWRRKESNGS